MLPQEQGGEAPDGKDFNGLFNLMSQFYYYTQNGGTYTFVPEVSDAIGDYPENALLWYFPEESPAQWLRSTKPNNTDNFIANPEVIGTSWVKENTEETGFPVGLIIPAVGFVEDVNFKLLDGSTLSQTGIYSQFATIVKAKTTAGGWPSCTDEEFEEEVAKTGQCGCFVIDNTANTIRLPLITRFIGGITSPSDIGKTLQDQFQGHEHLTTPTDGGFNSQGGGGSGTGSASNFSSTRTSLGVVQNQTDGLPRTGSETYPTHTKYPYYIVVASSGIKEPITVDINQIIGDLEGKADVDLSNAVPAKSFTSQSAGWAMPSDSYVDLTLGASGSTYTAPANGWIFLAKSSGAARQYVSVGIKDASGQSVIEDYNLVSSTTQNLTILFPISKGATYVIGYNATGATNFFRFIYAQGEI